MREQNFCFPEQQRACLTITPSLYDRRALDCTAPLPLLTSLMHLSLMTSTSQRVREALSVDGGLERLTYILENTSRSDRKDRRSAWRWILAYHCLVNVGVRSSEHIRARVERSGGVRVIIRVLESYLAMLDAERAARDINTYVPSTTTTTTAVAPSGPRTTTEQDTSTESNTVNATPTEQAVADIIDHNVHAASTCSDAVTMTLHGTTYRLSNWAVQSALERVRRMASTLVEEQISEIHPMKEPSIEITASSITLPPQSGEPPFREEDILLALQLLAYLSKHPRIRDRLHANYPVNVFALVEKFCGRQHSNNIQLWAGVVMRNGCRKDDTRGGLRRCAYLHCGRWETVPHEFAKCRRCRKAKYCSKQCQSRAWADGHRYWCVARQSTATTTTAGQPTATTNTAPTNTPLPTGLPANATATATADPIMVPQTATTTPTATTTTNLAPVTTPAPTTAIDTTTSSSSITANTSVTSASTSTTNTPPSSSSSATSSQNTLSVPQHATDIRFTLTPPPPQPSSATSATTATTPTHATPTTATTPHRLDETHQRPPLQHYQYTLTGLPETTATLHPASPVGTPTPTNLGPNTHPAMVTDLLPLPPTTPTPTPGAPRRSSIATSAPMIRYRRPSSAALAAGLLGSPVTEVGNARRASLTIAAERAHASVRRASLQHHTRNDLPIVERPLPSIGTDDDEDEEPIDTTSQENTNNNNVRLAVDMTAGSLTAPVAALATTNPSPTPLPHDNSNVGGLTNTDTDEDNLLAGHTGSLVGAVSSTEVEATHFRADLIPLS